MLNGLRVGSDPSQSWSVSQDARHHGGRIPFNLMEALKTGALTPEQALRYSLERNTTSASDSDAAGANTKAGNKDDEQGGFDGAVSFLSEVDIVDDVYYVMAGGGAANVEGQTPPGAVITRQRNGARDVWRVGVDAATTPHGPELPQSPNWWLTETNYDHWESPPAADNRRDPANALMEALGGANATDPEALFGVMSTWPVFNPHTTFTTMIDFATGAYNSTIWCVQRMKILKINKLKAGAFWLSVLERSPEFASHSRYPLTFFTPFALFMPTVHILGSATRLKNKKAQFEAGIMEPHVSCSIKSSLKLGDSFAKASFSK